MNVPPIYENPHSIIIIAYGFKSIVLPLIVVEPVVLCVVVPSTVLVSDPCTFRL